MISMKQRMYLSFLALLIALVIVIAIGQPALEEKQNNQPASIPKLSYAYAAPTVASPGESQVSEYNSFIGHTNTIELYNTKNSVVDAEIDVLNAEGTLLINLKETLPPHGSKRIVLPVEANNYGTILVSGKGIVFRNYVSKQDGYVLPFVGQ